MVDGLSANVGIGIVTLFLIFMSWEMSPCACSMQKVVQYLVGPVLPSVEKW